MDLRGMRVLVVDDSWHVGKALKNLLEDLGADVAGPAATAPEAEDLIAKQIPDLAFVDVKLREGELAYDLIDYLHKREIRVIIISGYAVLPQRVQNVAAILQKPFTESNLLATLRKVTQQQHSGG